MKTFIKKLFGKNKKNEIININIKRYEIEIKNDDGINIFITNEQIIEYQNIYIKQIYHENNM